MNILNLFKKKEVSTEKKRTVIGNELLRICKLNDSLTDSVDIPAFKRARIVLDDIEQKGALDFFFKNQELLNNIA